MSGICSSFSRHTISKLELNIDHLINIDLLIACFFGFFFCNRILLFLRLSSHPSPTALSLLGLQGGKRWGTPQTSHRLIQHFPPTEKKINRQDKCAHAPVVSGQQIFSYLLFKKKKLPTANRCRNDAFQQLQKSEWREMCYPQQ